MTTTRKRPLVHLSLSPDALSRLAEIATRCGETRSGVVERLIRECNADHPNETATQAEVDDLATLLDEVRDASLEDVANYNPAAIAYQVQLAQDRVGFNEAHHPKLQPSFILVAENWLHHWAELIVASPMSAAGPLASLLADTVHETRVNGSTKVTSVERGPDGLHFLLDVPITRVVGWRPL
jgi:hypothetical protein